MTEHDIDATNAPKSNVVMELQDQFGSIDIYLFDLLLKGRLTPAMSILEAGCGEGRNLNYFLRNGYSIFGIDVSPTAIQTLRHRAQVIAPNVPPDHFRVESLDLLSFLDATFDAVLCIAVLHFARDEYHFHSMLREVWRVLKPDGLFFARLASSIGIESLIQPLDNRRFHLPDGSDRFLVDEAFLQQTTSEMGGVFVEPIKTVNVQNWRCMTNWCIRKVK